MLNLIVAQAMGGDLTGGPYGRIFLAIIIFYIFFFIHLYIFRAIFKIPSFVRYQKAQIRLLEEIAKNQGVDGKKVQSIISETYGWEGAPTSSVTTETTEG